VFRRSGVQDYIPERLNAWSPERRERSDMSIESKQDLEALKQVGRVVGLTLQSMKRAVRPGVTTAELDRIGAACLQRYGARSAPHLVYGFPGAICISVNDEAVHGIPGSRTLREGDLVKLDVTAELNGYMADAALTVPLPLVSTRRQQLSNCAERAFHKALGAARSGRLVSDIGRVVEAEVRRSGFSVIRELSGHGVGRAIHEEPSVPNFFDRSVNQRLTEGLVITIEPIIAAGSGKVFGAADGWTVLTEDGSPSAHHEHTIVVTRDLPIILTAV
jgi:methionyl aminopeptidase